MPERSRGEPNRQAQRANVYGQLRDEMDRHARRPRHKPQPAAALKAVLQSFDPQPTAEAQVGLRHLANCERVRTACDQFRDWPVILSGLCIGNLKKMLSEHSKRLIVNYMDSVHQTLNSVFAGLIPSARENLDSKTWEEIQLLWPDRLEADREYVQELLASQDFFGGLNAAERRQIECNLRSIPVPIMDLASLNEDNKLLNVAMECIGELLSLERRCQLVRKMDQPYPPDYLWSLVAFALFHLERLEPGVVEGQGKAKNTGKNKQFDRDELAWYHFARLAHDVGERSDTIQKLCLGDGITATRDPPRLIIDEMVPVDVTDPSGKKGRQGRPKYRKRDKDGAASPSQTKDAANSPEDDAFRMIRESKIRAYLGLDYDAAMDRLKNFGVLDLPGKVTDEEQRRISGPTLPSILAAARALRSSSSRSPSSSDSSSYHSLIGNPGGESHCSPASQPPDNQLPHSQPQIIGDDLARLIVGNPYNSLPPLAHSSTASLESIPGLESSSGLPTPSEPHDEGWYTGVSPDVSMMDDENVAQTSLQGDSVSVTKSLHRYASVMPGVAIPRDERRSHGKDIQVYVLKEKKFVLTRELSFGEWQSRGAKIASKFAIWSESGNGAKTFSTVQWPRRLFLIKNRRIRDNPTLYNPAVLHSAVNAAIGRESFRGSLGEESEDQFWETRSERFFENNDPWMYGLREQIS